MSLRPTPSQTVGPFYAIGLCRRPDDELVPAAAPGALRLLGRLVDGAGAPVPDGVVEVWDGDRWGRAPTDADGRFSFRLAKPPPRRPGEAPRLDLLVFAQGLLRHQLTRVYFPDEPEANAADAVLAALPERDRRTLVARQEDGVLHFDVHLQGDDATVFFAA